MRSAAVNVMHPLVPPKKWSIVPKLPALFSCYQCSKMRSHVEMRGIGGGEGTAEIRRRNDAVLLEED